jgi:hypothetical protein
MLVNRGQRLKPEVLRDFFKTGRIALAMDVALQIREDFTLALGQRHPFFSCEQRGYRIEPE